MRVVISGISCSGKTTLINELKRLDLPKLLGRDIRYNTELAREFFSEWGPDHSYRRYDHLLANFNDMMEFERELILRFESTFQNDDSWNDIVFYDRGPKDYLINLIMNFYSGTPEQISKNNDLFSGLASTLNHLYLRDDDLLFTTDPDRVSTSVESDGFRPTVLNYRRPTEVQLFKLLHHDPNAIKLKEYSSNRVPQVVNQILSHVLKG